MFSKTFSTNGNSYVGAAHAENKESSLVAKRIEEKNYITNILSQIKTVKIVNFPFLAGIPEYHLDPEDGCLNSPS